MVGRDRGLCGPTRHDLHCNRSIDLCRQFCAMSDAGIERLAGSSCEQGQPSSSERKTDVDVRYRQVGIPSHMCLCFQKSCRCKSSVADEADCCQHIVPSGPQYRDESDLPIVMRLVDNELSEPYSIFTYRCAAPSQHPGQPVLSACAAFARRSLLEQRPRLLRVLAAAPVTPCSTSCSKFHANTVLHAANLPPTRLSVGTFCTHGRICVSWHSMAPTALA